MIRSATPHDIPAILAIWNPEIRETLITFNSVEKSSADIEALLMEKQNLGYAFLVFDKDDGILGFATYGQFRAGAGYKHTGEHTVVLATNARGNGVGSALMSAVEQHAKEQGFHSLWAGVSSGNPDAVAFHKHLGYSEIATLPEVGRKFDRWLDLLLMQKRL